VIIGLAFLPGMGRAFVNRWFASAPMADEDYFPFLALPARLSGDFLCLPTLLDGFRGFD
jgi:hypothetical protein